MATNIFPDPSDTPTLRGTALPTFFGRNLRQTAPGYASSVGSAIFLPDTSTATVVANDVTGSALWTFTIASFTAAITGTVTNWVGWYMNDAATELFGIALDTGTVNDTFYLFSINVSGTITEIGNNQPSSDFTVAPPSWGATSSIITDGSGGFKIVVTSINASGSEFAIMDSTGTFTTDPTAIMTNANAGPGNAAYETTGGKLLSEVESDPTTNTTTLKVSNKTDSAVIVLPYDAVKGIATGTNGMFFIRWQDFIIIWDAAAAGNMEGKFKYTEAQVDTFADDLLAYGGNPA